MKRTDLLGFTITEQSKAQDLADDYSVEELQDRLDQIYRDMEQEAEPEGGPIADMYADEIHAYEEAIRLKKGKKTDQSYGKFDPGPGELTYGDATGQNMEEITYAIEVEDQNDKNQVMVFLEDDLTRDLQHFGVMVDAQQSVYHDMGIDVKFSMEDGSQIKSRIQKLIKAAIEEFVGDEMGHSVELLEQGI